jgi:molybdate transport system permease protein
MARRPAAATRARHTSARVPGVVVALAVIGVAFFAIPLAGLIWRAPWRSVWDVVSTPEARDALRLSLITSLSAAALSIVFGLPLAWVQARVSYPGRRVVRALVLLPLVLPPVVAGVALLAALGRRGLAGRYLADIGVHLPFHMTGAIVAETFVAMPFLVLTVESAFRTADQRYEDAARTLGASRFTVFRRVTLPAIRPALIAGTVLCWARALGEFGATITFAGNTQGKTQTLPLFVYITLEGPNSDAAIVLSLMLVAISLVVLVSLRDRWLTAV